MSSVVFISYGGGGGGGAGGRSCRSCCAAFLKQFSFDIYFFVI